jgi:hypothetical protein
MYIIFINSSCVFAQEEKYKKAEITNTIEITGDINVAWTYLSNLGNLEKLIPSTIEKSTLVGNGKGSIVTLILTNNKGIIVEKVVQLDNQKRIISYIMLSTPLPIKNYLASFTISKIDDKTFEVKFEATFKVQDKNRKARIDAFNTLQKELLSNTKKLTNEIK